MEITHGDKVLYPKDQITKMDVINYYKAVSKRMLPHLKDRPLTLQSFPHGIHKEGFIQKHASQHYPKWVTTTQIKTKDKGTIPMVLCNTQKMLLFLANQNCITPHIWLSKKDKPDMPDRMIFDLDPPKGNFTLAIEGANALRKVLEESLKFKTYLMTTGSQGLHIVIPIKRCHSFDEVRTFARDVATLIAEENPKQFTTQVRKSGRRGRLFIDYLRNAYGQTSVAPYSMRALDGAPIATPLSWTELKPSLSSQSFHLKNIKKRLTAVDPWAGMSSKGYSLKRVT